VYLSEEWFTASAQALESAVIVASGDSQEPVSFGYTITDIPDDHPQGGHDVSYRITIDPRSRTARLDTGEGHGDVRFSMPYRVAEQIAQGSGSGQRAFLDGEVRMGGNVGLLLERASELAQLSGLLGRASD
jgi:hypothetical protein